MLMREGKKYIDSFEIESVIIDTNRSIDDEWMK
jgi:hypothetical protein